MISYPTHFDLVIFFFDLKHYYVRVQTLKINLSVIKCLEVSSEMTQKIKNKKYDNCLLFIINFHMQIIKLKNDL